MNYRPSTVANYHVMAPQWKKYQASNVTIEVIMDYPTGHEMENIWKENSVYFGER